MRICSDLQLGTLLHDRRVELMPSFTAWYLASGSPSSVQVMVHSLVSCFRIAGMGLGNVSQRGILPQDRRAEFM